MSAVRTVLASALAAGVLIVAGAGAASADTSAQRPTYHYTGQGGRDLGPLQLSGSYLISVYARFLPYAHPAYESSCQFAARFDGLDVPVPAGLVDWGTGYPVLAMPSFHKQQVVDLPAGRYVFHISPLTGCDWDLVIEPSAPAPTHAGPAAIFFAKILDGSTEVTHVQAGRSYDVAVYLQGDPALVSRATGTVTTVQDGRDISHITLITAGVTNDGALRYLAVKVLFAKDPAPGHFGPLVLRFDVDAGSAHLTKSIGAMLEP